MKLNLHTEICDMLGIEYPIFAFSHCRDVISEVSKAGGFGVLGVFDMTFDEVVIEVEWLKKHTGKPFGMDLLIPQDVPEVGTRQELMSRIPRENIEFMDKLRRALRLPDGYTPTYSNGGYGSLGLGAGGTLASQEEQLDAICQSKPPVFAGGLGMNRETVDKCHRAGIKVISLVGNVKQARRVASLGVDIIVAQGTEAGGHVGRIGTMVLVPAVVDAVKPIPVLAAGGIGDGRGVVAALALGAAGVWTGTIWLATHEHPLEDCIKERLLTSTEEDAVVTRIYSGKPTRRLRNKFIEYWDQPGAPKPLPAPYQSMYLPLPTAGTSADPDRTWARPDLRDWISTPAGQVMGLMRQRKSARQVVYDMVSEAIDILGTDADHFA